MRYSGCVTRLVQFSFLLPLAVFLVMVLDVVYRSNSHTSWPSTPSILDAFRRIDSRNRVCVCVCFELSVICQGLVVSLSRISLRCYLHVKSVAWYFSASLKDRRSSHKPKLGNRPIFGHQLFFLDWASVSVTIKLHIRANWDGVCWFVF